jgi:hypothetical protein
MIRRYLLTLTPEQEERVLTTAMRPGSYHKDGDVGPCLVGTACDVVVPCGNVERRYDDLCERLGTERANALIRDRIVSNMARRVLAPSREVVPA